MKTNLRNYKYLFSLTPAFFVICGNLLGGWWVMTNLIYSLVFVALMELILPEDKDNSSGEKDDEFPTILLFLHAFLQVPCIITLFTFACGPHTTLQLVLAALATGTNTGASAMVVAHELVHRKNKWCLGTSKFLLFTAANLYLYVDHNRIHHKWVGTRRDPATPRKWENLYSFCIRSYTGQVKCSYKLEKDRMKKQNKPLLHPSNYIFGSLYLLTIALTLLTYFLGPQILLAFLIQAFMAGFMLEYTNYIEHYGLKREENEKITEFLSWQSDNMACRFFLIDLSRHADHHAHAFKPYHTLESYAKGPKLPSGYSSMFYVASVPSLWFRSMHKRLGEFESNQLSA